MYDMYIYSYTVQLCALNYKHMYVHVAELEINIHLYPLFFYS